MKATIIYAIYMFCNILVALLLIRALMSWFVRDMYSPMGKIYGAIIRFTEPIVMPFRRMLSRLNTGMLDFSVLLAMLVIEMAGNILVKIIVLF